MVPGADPGRPELPADTLIDGEIVIAADDGCADFTALQAQLSSARNHCRGSMTPTADAGSVSGRWCSTRRRAPQSERQAAPINLDQP